MRALLLTFVLLAACGEPAQVEADENPLTPSVPAALSVAGRLENGAINEASGLVASRRDPRLLWTMNDEGAPYLYAVDHDGDHRGRLNIDDAKNRDWEDLGAFVHEGEPYIVVADIGDNEARRRFVTLYVVHEPDLSDDRKQKQKAAWRIDFRYEDGPRDAEAIAVDAPNRRVLVLSKREIPAALYEVPLFPGDDDVAVAKRLGAVDSLPQPSRRDVAIAPHIDTWYWQPSGMDLSHDGTAAIVLTYSAIYLYRREGGEDWYATLRRAPLAFGLGNIREAESIAFAPGDRQIFFTVEDRHAPLFRIDLEGAPQQ